VDVLNIVVTLLFVIEPDIAPYPGHTAPSHTVSSSSVNNLSLLNNVSSHAGRKWIPSTSKCWKLVKEFIMRDRHDNLLARLCQSCCGLWRGLQLLNFSL